MGAGPYGSVPSLTAVNWTLRLVGIVAATCVYYYCFLSLLRIILFDSFVSSLFVLFLV